MIVQGKMHHYAIGKLVAEAEAFRLYLCTQEETGRECLFKIAPDAANNGALDREAFILGELERRANALEAEYATVKKDPNLLLNYGLHFPELVEGFLFATQGNRRVNIFAFREVPEVRRMVPIGNIIQKDHLRVDLRTSAWIMGKALKILTFAHSEGISVGRVDVTNLLIEPDQHYVLIFDWSTATLHTNCIPAETRRSEIAQAAQSVIALIGGDHDTGEFPEDQCIADVRTYTDYLVALANGRERDAGRAHRRFYELVDGVWPRVFYPFTTISRTSA